MKKKNTLKKALLVTLCILGLAAGFGQNTLHTMAAEDSGYVFDNSDPDTNPVDFTL